MSRIDPYCGYNFLITLMDSASVSGHGVESDFEDAGRWIQRMHRPRDEPGHRGIQGRRQQRNDSPIPDTREMDEPPTETRPCHLKRSLALALWIRPGHGQTPRRDHHADDLQCSPAKAWKFKRGLPVKWAGSVLNAMQGQIAFEEIEIAHEGLKLL